MPKKLSAVSDDGPALFNPVQLGASAEQINGLWYGPEGTGKTSAVAAMANQGKTLIVNAEAGLKLSPLRRLGVSTDNIRVIPQPGQDLSFELLEEAFIQMRADLLADPSAWAGTVWDSMTEIHKKLLDDVVTYQRDKALGMGRDRERFFIDRADYGVMTEQVRLLVRRFRDLPCHFAATALEKREQDDDGKVAYVPAVTPALVVDVLGYMDIVCHTSVEEVAGAEEYQGSFRPIGKYRGKDRWKVLPRKLVDPTFDRVLAYVEENLQLSDDPVMQEAAERRAQEKADAE